MRALLEKRLSRMPQRRDEPQLAIADDAAAGRQFGEVRFVPARWLVLAASIAGTLLRGARVSKLGIATLLWTLAPRPFKLVAAGLALAATIVLIGALAAIALLALQLT